MKIIIVAVKNAWYLQVVLAHLVQHLMYLIYCLHCKVKYFIYYIGMKINKTETKEKGVKSKYLGENVTLCFFLVL